MLYCWILVLPIMRWCARLVKWAVSLCSHGMSDSFRHWHHDSLQGLTFWDGRNQETNAAKEIHYETRSGDLAFIDRCVEDGWCHQMIVARGCWPVGIGWQSSLISYCISQSCLAPGRPHYQGNAMGPGDFLQGRERCLMPGQCSNADLHIILYLGSYSS